MEVFMIPINLKDKISMKNIVQLQLIQQNQIVRDNLKTRIKILGVGKINQKKQMAIAFRMYKSIKVVIM